MSATATMQAGMGTATRRGETAVHCKGVTKHYGEGTSKVWALRGIDLEIGAGELTMLVGPSGCGKTTLISVVAGILDRDDGECTVFGRDFTRMSASEKTRFRGENVGFVFQQFNLLPTLTAAENVAVPLMILGKGRSAAVKQGAEMLEKVGLKDKLKSLPSQLSGGQQQRVAIARALVHEPKLIVCDEPTSALDHDTGHVIMRMLKNVALNESRSLVIVTHDARIFEFADKIAKMDDGRIKEVSNGVAEVARRNGGGGGGGAGH
ncbi:MAG: ABC transporter ATP-binding protein [Planctomycetaceae bacterium]|jgi:putative ABC transport system ATP-binding protein|nr:ABC transporter ATP-binding protein [Planctomycetaceae bacterium]